MKNITEINLYSDGGSRGNPGPAASAWLIFDLEGKVLDFGADYLGAATNNHAEYVGLLNGLKSAQKITSGKVLCRLDSELVVKQLQGEYKIKDANLQKIAQEIKQLVQSFEQVRFMHVERALNSHADRLVNICLDAKLNNR